MILECRSLICSFSNPPREMSIPDIKRVYENGEKHGQHKMVLSYFVRNLYAHYLTYMEIEARIGYLCYKASRYELTLDEECELMGYIGLDPEIPWLIMIEFLLRDEYDK